MNRYVSLVAALSLAYAPGWAQAQTADPTAPTAGKLTPEQIDAQWIAANTKSTAMGASARASKMPRRMCAMQAMCSKTSSLNTGP